MAPIWFLVGVGPEAHACGGMVHREGLSAESRGAEVLFELGSDSVTVSYAERSTRTSPSSVRARRTTTGGCMLAPGRLANPLDWIVAAEAYAQLSEETKMAWLQACAGMAVLL